MTYHDTDYHTSSLMTPSMSHRLIHDTQRHRVSHTNSRMTTWNRFGYTNSLVTYNDTEHITPSQLRHTMTLCMSRQLAWYDMTRRMLHKLSTDIPWHRVWHINLLLTYHDTVYVERHSWHTMTSCVCHTLLMIRHLHRVCHATFMTSHDIVHATRRSWHAMNRICLTFYPLTS